MTASAFAAGPSTPVVAPGMARIPGLSWRNRRAAGRDLTGASCLSAKSKGCGTDPEGAACDVA